MTGVLFGKDVIPVDVVRQCAEHIRKHRSPVISRSHGIGGGEIQFFARRSLSAVRDSEVIVALMAETSSLVEQFKDSMQ